MVFSRLPNRVFVIHNTLSKEKQVHTYLSDDKLRKVHQQQRIATVSEGVLDDFIKIVPSTLSITAYPQSNRPAKYYIAV